MEEELDKALVEKVPRKLRWHQFTIGSILGATSWMALCFALIALLNRNADADFTLILLAAIFLSPFIAAGTLVGHPFRGVAIGTMLLSVFSPLMPLVIVTTVVLYLGWAVKWQRDRNEIFARLEIISVRSAESANRFAANLAHVGGQSPFPLGPLGIHGIRQIIVWTGIADIEFDRLCKLFPESEIEAAVKRGGGWNWEYRRTE